MQANAASTRVWGLGGVIRTAVLAIFYMALVTLAYDRAKADISAWRFTYWLFNYEHEFLKRGLVGELVRGLELEATPGLAVTVSKTALFLLALTFILLLVRLDYLRQKKELWLFGALVLLCPFTLQHLVYDIGRSDVFVLLVCLVPLFVISGTSQVLCKAAWVAAASFVSLLIHEASYISTVPLVLHAGGVAENIALTFRHSFTPASLVHHAYMFVLSSPFFWLIATLCRSLLRVGDKRLESCCSRRCLHWPFIRSGTITSAGGHSP